MKKISLLLLSMTLLFACDNSVNNTPESSSSSSPNTAKNNTKKEMSSKTVSKSINPENWPQTSGGIAIDSDVEKRIDDLLSKMTNADKVGQLVQGDMGSIKAEELKTYRLGSVLAGGNSAPNGKPYGNVKDWISSSDSYWEALMEPREDGGITIPPLLGIDAVHGHNNVIGGTIFPHNIGLGAMNDPALVRKVAEVTAKELVVTGHDWTFAPTLAVARNDRWGRTYESYAETGDIVARYATEIVEGLQGTAKEGNLFGDGKVMSTAKHYVGDGGTFNGTDQGNNIDSEAKLRDIHAAGYPPAIEAGVQSIMASFSSWQDQKLHGHKALMQDVLKDRMSFNGFIVGDWNGHGHVDGCTNTNCPTSLLSGLDMYMAPDSWKELYQNLLIQVNSGVIPETRLNEAVRRILRAKIRSGLFDKPKPSERKFGGDSSVLGSPEHKVIAREAVRKSLVLLKNDGTLPINPKMNVLVAGSAADSIAQASGGWSLTWQGVDIKNSEFPNAQSIYAGIEETITAAGGEVSLNVSGEYSEKPDVAIVVFGETPYAEFMGDVEHVGYDIQGTKEIKLLKKLQADGIPVVSVFISGRPLWTNPELNASNSFIAAWLPGTEAGAISEVIFSKADGAIANDFHGKLSFSWPKTADPNPLNVDDENYQPLFAYGYGLTYTDKPKFTRLSEETGLISNTQFNPGLFFKDGSLQSPWKLSLTSGENGEQKIIDTEVNVTTGAINLKRFDHNAQEDAWRATWDGSEKASVSIFDETTNHDYSRQNTGALELAFEINVQEALSKPIKLGWGCKPNELNCSSSVDITNTIKSLPKDEWKTIRVSLKCFENNGADMNNTNIPFKLETAGKASIAFSHIRLDSDQDGKITCPN